MFDKFSERHIGVSNEKDLKAMLDVIGVKSVDELISQVIPQSIRLRKPLALPAEGMSEYEFAAHIRELADRNQPYRSFIGMGYYPSAVPAVVTRNVFENPAWYTSYTPYQAEISQGRLEALLNFQTAVISLTGMEIGNCSLLDEGTAAAEAMAMMFSLRSRDAVREGRNQLFVDRNIFPQTLDVLLTRSEPFGIELIVDEYDEYEFTGREFGAIVQYPAADGRVRDYSDFTAAAHAKGALVTVAADLLSQAEHDKKIAGVVDAFHYQIGKEIGAMAAAMVTPPPACLGMRMLPPDAKTAARSQTLSTPVFSFTKEDS